MVEQRWKDLLRQPGTLPALPDVLIRLQAGLYRLDMDIDQLCAELQCDPALVAEIIKTINSPLFGVPRRIESVKQAVMLLGLRRVRAIILSQSLRQSLATYNSPAFAAFRWWDRSMLNAITAATLCRQISPDLAEEAFLAGLVADIGILILARYEPAYQQTLLGAARMSSADFAAAAFEKTGIDHAELAGEVFDYWQFPPMIALAVRRHHDTTLVEETEGFLLPRVVFFAGVLSDWIVTGQPDCWARLSGVVARQLSMSEDELCRLADDCRRRYRDTAVPLGHGDFLDGGAKASASA